MLSMTVLFIGLCAAVFFYDILLRRVPNQLILLALTVHVVYLISSGVGIGGITPWQSLLGGMIGLMIFVPLYAMKAMGAGDVKFFALLGLLLGPKFLIPVWLISSLLAGIHAVCFYLTQHGVILIPGLDSLKQRIFLSEKYQRMIQMRHGRQGIPYAAYLAVAAILINVYQLAK